MTVEQFIEKASAGGWLYRNGRRHWTPSEIAAWGPEEVFLDPLAWKAVGKVEGWPDHHKNGKKCSGHHECPCDDDGDTWLDYQHGMIDALAEGKTVDQFLETL